MPDRNGSGYVSPTEGMAVHKLTLKEEREAWYKEHPLPPKSPDHLDEDALYIADNRRPANRWTEFTEAQEQSDLFRWADLAKGKYPELTLMFHIPNGGSRNKDSYPEQEQPFQILPFSSAFLCLAFSAIPTSS